MKRRFASLLFVLGIVSSLFFTGWLPADAGHPKVVSQPAEVQISHIYLPVLVRNGSAPSGNEPGSCLTAEEASLGSQINEYRRANSLPNAPLSKSLSMVAQWHVWDLEANHPDSGTASSGLECNLHSWSDKGYWTPVCYTSDHYYASGMWSKPKEITRGVYIDNGYEIAYWHSNQATASGALSAWKSSSGHNAVILEQGTWASIDWYAMGIGISKHYAVVWFGEMTDPVGTISQCQQ